MLISDHAHLKDPSSAASLMQTSELSSPRPLLVLLFPPVKSSGASEFLSHDLASLCGSGISVCQVLSEPPLEEPLLLPNEPVMGCQGCQTLRNLHVPHKPSCPPQCELWSAARVPSSPLQNPCQVHVLELNTSGRSSCFLFLILFTRTNLLITPPHPSVRSSSSVLYL